MGANEDELARIAAAGPFTLPGLGELRNSLLAAAETLKTVAGSEGWDGLAAGAASDRLELLSREYYDMELRLADLQEKVDRANEVRSAALADYEALPPAKAPDWVHGMLDAFDYPGIPQPVDLAQGGLALIEGFLGGQREQAAGRILQAYADALVAPGDEVLGQTRAFAEQAGRSAGEPIPVPSPGPVDGPWSPGPGSGPSYGPSGGHTSPGYSSGYVSPGPWTPPGHPGYTGTPGAPGSSEPPAYPNPDIGVDDSNGGVLPGGPGSVPGGLIGGPGAGGGGLPVGAGIGAGAAIAGAATAARLGGTAGAAGVGAAARLGTGGLLGGAGMGAPGMNGAAAANAARTGGGAGARGGAGGGMMGAGANAGGSREGRRRGRGLGGPMAPKLDDEDLTMLPGAGARAGGRAEASEPSDDD